jgi:uracil-DNA glycosylase
MSRSGTGLEDLLTRVRACRICRDQPSGRPLPHEPRPVLQASATARILIAGQAPGTRVHQSGRPFTDPSGDRLRRWLGIGPELFYDAEKVAILPMGFCFPGLDAKGADLPPRPECAPRWRTLLIDELPALRMIVVLGLHAARWHLGTAVRPSLQETVAAWPAFSALAPPVFVLPHPSWRNNALLKAAPWIESDLLPALQSTVREALQ